MLRCYDMTEGYLQLDEGLPVEPASLPSPAVRQPVQPWLAPRLQQVCETHDDYRMVRVPPGFISC